MWLCLISSAGVVALTSLLDKRWYLCGNIQTWVCLGLSAFQLGSRMAAPLTVSSWLGKSSSAASEASEGSWEARGTLY